MWRSTRMLHAATPTSKDSAEHLVRPLEIVRVDLHPISIPLLHPMRMSGVLIRSADNLLVRIETADGQFGWGEAASAPTMTGETLWGMAGAAQWIADAILHQDLRFRAAVLDRARTAIYANPSAQSAIEMAILDLVGRTLGVGLVDLIGGRRRDTLQPMWMLGHATPEADAAEAVAKLAEGYGFFKLKVGTKSLEGDIAAALAVREVVGTDVTLCADANGGFSAAHAAAFMRGAVDAGLAFLEQPLPAEDLSGMATLQGLDLVPIGADEGIHTIADVEAHAARKAAAGVSLKLIKLGGIEVARRTADRAAALGLHVNIAAKVAETSLASAAAAHLACASPNVNWGISLTQVYLEHDPVVRPMRIEQGRVSPPAGPGLGIEVDEQAVRSYRAPPP